MERLFKKFSLLISQIIAKSLLISILVRYECNALLVKFYFHPIGNGSGMRVPDSCSIPTIGNLDFISSPVRCPLIALRNKIFILPQNHS